MRRLGKGSGRLLIGSYLEKRRKELASPTTRSLSDPLAQWALRNIRLEGVPFSFEGHEYLRTIYDDTSPHVVLSKAAQIGGTTWAILRSVHACLQGLDVLYLFPTKTDVLEFSKSRVSPLIVDNPFLWEKMRDTDTAGLKRIGDAYLYLRGMQSTVGMKSIPIDVLVLDELDESPPVARSMAMERLSHSDYRRVIELSNPSLPDYGIDEQYQKSDQRHWTLQCPACNHWAALDKEFPIKLGQEVRIILPRKDGTCYRACPKCAAELDLAAGEWVADFPGRPTHGYRISQLFSSKVDPGEILTEYRVAQYPERFFNLKIGIPWTDLGTRLDQMSVLSLCGDKPMPESDNRGYCAMGVDTGKTLHVVILHDQKRGESVPRELVHLAICHDFGELDALMERFDITCTVIDGLPETHATREFARRHRGRTFLSFFVETQRGGPNFDWEKRIVQSNRTESLDASRAIIRDKMLILPRRSPLLETFAKHMVADARMLQEDEETGMKRYKYIRTGEDHFSLAFTYALLATKGWRRARAWGRD